VPPGMPEAAPGPGLTSWTGSRKACARPASGPRAVPKHKKFIYDRAAGVPAVLFSKRTTNTVPATYQYAYYVREPQGELLASFDLADPQVKRYYHFDALGSTVLVTNGSGTVSDSFTYGAWGAVLNTPQNNLKPYQYVGQLGYYQHSSDRGTAMHDLLQLGVRFYDRDIGRFTQRDAVGSSYSYCWDAPVTLADPSGATAKIPPQCKGKIPGDDYKKKWAGKDNPWTG